MGEENKYTQLCVWHGVVLESDGRKVETDEFVDFMKTEFNARIKFAEQVFTLPDMKDGVPVPDTGERSDLFFYVHQDDIPHFAISRLEAGIRWWEDVLGNGGGRLYPKEILEKYPKTW